MDMLNKAAQAIPVDLLGPTVVNLTPSELLSVEQAGDDLLLQLVNGDAISVERFFAQGAEQPILWLVDEQDELVQLNLASTPQGELQADFMPLGESAALGDAAIDVTQGLEPAFGSSAGGAGMGAAAGTGGMSPAMGLAIFGGIAAAGVAIAENSSSSSSSSARPAEDGGMEDAGLDVTGYAGLQQAIDGVADFIDAEIGAVTVAIGQLLDEEFSAAMVSAESRDAAMEAVQGLSAASSEAELVAAAEAITELVVANRIAIAENFAQLLPEVDIAETAAAIAADVEAGLMMPEGLNAAEQAVFETLVAVQTNGAIVEALLNAANATYELGLEVPEYMAPEVPETADLESLLAAATDSVAAVGALAVPSVAAIAEIIDGLLDEQNGDSSDENSSDENSPGDDSPDEQNSDEQNHVPGLTFGFIDTDALVSADLSDSTNATQINVALAASGLAPMIAGATDNNADGAAGLSLDANGAELDTLAIDASGDASRFNFAVANNGAVIDTTVVTGDADLFLNLTNGDGYLLETLDASAASGNIILVNGGPAVQDKRLEFGDGDVLYVTASGNLNGSDIINMGGGHNAVETHFREGGIQADYQANVDAINAGSGIATFILDAWLDDAGGPLEMKVSDFATVRDFIFDDTHAGGMANVQDTFSNDIKVGDVSDDSTFFVRALTDDGVMQSYTGAEDAVMLNLKLAGADAGAAARVASDLAVNNIEVADTTGTFNARFALEDGAELNLGGKVSGDDGVVNVAAGGGTDLTLDASGLNSQAMIDASTNAAGAVVSVSGSANGLALESAGTVIGSDQSDLIFGSSGADVMTGGGGADVFHISTTASGQGGNFFLAADADVVTDFSVADGDLLAFSGLDASHSADGGPLFGSGDTYLVGGEAANFAEARLIASQGLEDSGVFFVAAEVNGSTFIFAQEGDSAGTIGQVVKLKDVGLDELDANGTFIAGEVDFDDEALMLLSDDDALIMEGEQEDGMAEMPQEASAGDMVGMTEIMAMPTMEEIHAVM